MQSLPPGSFLPTLPPTSEKLSFLGSELTSLLSVVRLHLSDFARLLVNPRNLPPGGIQTTIGKMRPLGPERLKVCELFAEILHLQYLVTSSPLFEGMVLDLKSPELNGKKGSVSSFELGKRMVVDELVSVTNRFVETNILPVCLVRRYLRDSGAKSRRWG